MLIDGAPALCCATGSLAVDQNWRGLGLAKTVGQKFLDQTGADLLVGADSTDVAFGMWRSLGMESLERRWLQTHSRILADGAALGTALSQLARLPDFVGHTAGRCLTSLIAIAGMPAHRSKSLDVKITDRFVEPDAADLKFCRASAAATYSRRDIEILNWMYFGTPYHQRTRAVFVARSGSQLVGYLAMKQWRGHSYYLLECRCRDADPAIARELIWGAREFARKNGAQSIIVRPYSPMIEMAIPSQVSIQFRRPPTTYCYQFEHGRMDIADWEVTPGDGDVSVT